MEVILLFGGNYNSHSASSNRAALYAKGLRENNINVRVISNYKRTRGRVSKYLWTLVAPFFLGGRILRQPNNDSIILAYTYGWVNCFFVWMAARLRRMKFVIELNEKPYTMYGSRFTEVKAVKKFNIFMFRQLGMRLPDGFIVISKNLGEYLTVKDRDKIIRVPVIIDPSAVNIETPALKKIQKPFLLHAGSLSEQKDGIVGVFKAFAIANARLNGELYFYLTDKTAPAKTIESINKIIRENNLEEKVFFLGLIPKPELIAYQKECSMLILNKPDNEQNRYNFSTKLGEYLVLGKPVVYTPVGEMNVYLQDKQNAFKVMNNDSGSLAAIIVKIITNDGNEVEQIALQGKKLAETEFNYYYQGKRLAAFLKKIYGEAGGN